MHPIDAASRGSTRLLEYLSCDGSRSGGGGAFVPDCRRSIIPRLQFASPLQVWVWQGLLASKPTRLQMRFCLPLSA